MIINRFVKSLWKKDSKFDKEKKVICPVCREEFNHLIKIIINAGGKIFIIDSTGLTKQKDEPTYRGTSILIYYRCEMGHYWHEHQQFHKGIVYKRKFKNPEMVNSKDIWRD